MGSLFPPFEPKQSIQLRVALFKRLSELKRDGLFGKDVTIRKTMFDDCKGPKFEELLAIFSTCVLHKIMAASTKDESITKQILEGSGLDERLYLPLTLAYETSFSFYLAQRQTLERRWLKFGRVLKSKKEELDQRAHSIDEAASLRQEKRIPKRTLNRLEKHIGTNWTGNNEWVDVLMRSDRVRYQRTLLQRPFEEVWTHACKDTLYAIRPEDNESLLQELERRVQEQNSRLERWKSISGNLLTSAQPTLDRSEYSVVARTGSTSALIGSMARSPTSPPPKICHKEAPDDWTDVDTEGDVTSNRTSSYMSRTSRQGSHSRPVSGVYRPSFPVSPRKSSALAKNSTSPTKDNSSSFARPCPGQEQDYFSNASLLHSSHQRNMEQPDSSEAPFQRRLTPLRNQSSHSLYEEGEVGDEFENLDDESTLAAEIVSAVRNAEPSPLESLPSLAERTRMSTAFMTPRRPSPPTTPMNLRQGSPERDSFQRFLSHEASVEIPDSRATLAERTRQSMSLMSAKPRNQRRPQVSRTSSAWSAKQSESPRKAQGSSEPANETYLEETLQDMDGDYESVFKSRPRIAVSPVLRSSSNGMGEIKEALELDEEQSMEDDFS